MKEQYRFLMKNTVLFTIANFSNKLIVFLLLPFYTTFLTTEEYAVIDLISITQQLIFPIITLDITEAVIRFGMERNKQKNNVFLIGCFFVFVSNFIMLCGCLFCASLTRIQGRFIIFFFLFNLFISINTLLSSFLRTVDKVYVITVASIFNTLVTTILNVLLIAKFSYGIDGYYIACIVGNILAIIIMLGGGKIGEYIKCENKHVVKIYTKEMLQYSIPLIPNALFWWVNSSLDRYFLTAMGSLAYVGMYAAANKIPSILSTLTSIFQQSWGLSMFKENDSEDKKTFFDNVFCAYEFMVMAVSLLLIVFSKIICEILLNKNFFAAWIWVPWLILGFYSNSISSFIGTEFTAAKKTLWIFITTSISAVVNIILNIVLIPKYNGFGAAIATCVSYVILVLIRVIILNKRFDIHIKGNLLLKSHIILLCAIICMSLFNGTILFLQESIIIILFMIINKKTLFNYVQMIMKIVKNKGKFV